MLELTNDQCKELERRVAEKLEEMYPDDTAGLRQAICKIAVPAVIHTIREYERMKQNPETSE